MYFVQQDRKLLQTCKAIQILLNLFRDSGLPVLSRESVMLAQLIPECQALSCYLKANMRRSNHGFELLIHIVHLIEFGIFFINMFICS